MSTPLEQIKKIDRLLADPSITPGERFAAESTRQTILQKATEQSYAERVKSAQRNARSRPNVPPSKGGNGSARQNTTSPRWTTRAVETGISRAEATARYRANPGFASNPINSTIAILNLGQNLREGWERGTSGRLGNPVFGAIEAFEEAAGAFVPAYEIADFAVDTSFDLLRSFFSPENGNNPEELSQSFNSEAPESPSNLGFPGGQDPGVVYRITARGYLNGTPITPVSNYQGVGPLGIGSISNSSGGRELFVTERGGERVAGVNAVTVSGGPDDNPSIEIIDLQRVDGLPDNYTPPVQSPSTSLGSRSQQTPSAVQIPKVPTAPVPNIPSFPNDQSFIEPTGTGQPAPNEIPFPDISSFPFGIPGRADQLRPQQRQTRRARRIIPRNVPPACSPCGTAGMNQTRRSEQNILDRLGSLSFIPQLGLLGTILDLVQQIGDVVGLGAFPITAPANLNAKATGTTTLNNLGEAHLWQAKNLDSTIGGWPNTIQDLDNGNPIENLTVSDSLAEIQGMLMAMAIGQGINQQGIFKTLTETTGIKQQSMLARQFSQANAEYLGYNLNQTTRTVPNTYTPGVENILELLNPGKIPMEAVENVDDMDLQSCLRELCASAAIIRAVFFRNTGTDDIEQALREKIDQARNVNDTAGSTDFREYLNQVEQGFGIPSPYGRDQTQGPRLSDRSDPTTP